MHCCKCCKVFLQFFFFQLCFDLSLPAADVSHQGAANYRLKMSTTILWYKFRGRCQFHCCVLWRRMRYFSERLCSDVCVCKCTRLFCPSANERPGVSGGWRFERRGEWQGSWIVMSDSCSLTRRLSVRPKHQPSCSCVPTFANNIHQQAAKCTRPCRCAHVQWHRLHLVPGAFCWVQPNISFLTDSMSRICRLPSMLPAAPLGQDPH